jgi:hypothetical protein
MSSLNECDENNSFPLDVYERHLLHKFANRRREMTAIQTSREPELRLRRIIARFATTLGVLAAPWARMFAGSGRLPDWRSLDDRLLRDIGATPLDAEIARLDARMGAIQTDDLEAVSRRGLSAGQFLQQIKGGCCRKRV